MAGYERNFRNALRDRLMVAWVAHDGARIVGQVSAHDLERDEPQLGMVVAGSHRGRGIGRALIEAVGAWARARGSRALGLRVFPDNVPALALYRAAGFTDVALERAAIPRPRRHAPRRAAHAKDAGVANRALRFVRLDLVVELD